MSRIAMCCAVAVAAGVLGGVSAGRAATKAVVARYEDARFVPVDPARPELAQVAVLRGDPAAGPSSMLMRMPRTQGVLHYHTSDYELVLVEGRMKHTFEQDEARAPELGPGSYWFQPGREPHADSCLTDVCVMFITWSGKRDAHLATRR
jgi:hypothetical protein